jgi:hypothetical protein
MIVLNLGDEQQQVTLPRKVSQIVINNMKNWVHIEDSAPTFLQYQGIVYRVA